MGDEGEAVVVARPIGAGKECIEQRPAVGGDERGVDVLARPGDAVRGKAGEVGDRKSAETGEPTA